MYKKIGMYTGGWEGKMKKDAKPKFEMAAVNASFHFSQLSVGIAYR